MLKKVENGPKCIILSSHAKKEILCLIILYGQEGEETASQTSDELDLEVQEVMDTIKDGILEDEDDNEVTPAHEEQPINQSTDKPHPDKKYD